MATPKNLERRAEQLRPLAMPSNLESIAEFLHEEACCGSRSLWDSLKPEDLKTPSAQRTQFFARAHEGMWSAQDRFLRRLSNSGPEPMSRAEFALYRNAMDAIGWQLLQGQLCFARRLYRGHRQPNPSTSNLQSVVEVARQLKEAAPNSMVLISDLTKFVQIGDLLNMDPESGFSIIEVKEGKKNKDISEMAKFYQTSNCELFKHHISQSESIDTFKQFERVVRQMGRMKFATDILNKGVAVDPDTSLKIGIPEPIFPLEDWSVEFNSTCDRALDRGWAVDAIDETVLLGCYSDPKMMSASPYVFLSWIDQCVGREPPPTARLIDCVSYPLALPIFSLPTARERMMDLLFGRIHVCLGISLEGLVGQCGKHGIAARPPNKSERRAISNSKSPPVKFRGQPLVLQRGDRSMIVSDGLFERWMFHFQRPIAVLNAMFDSTSTTID